MSAATAANLARLRKERGLSREEVEVGAKLGAGTVSRLEKDGRTPRPETLAKLASFYGVALSAIDPSAVAPRSNDDEDPYPERAQAIALLTGSYPAGVLAALRHAPQRAAKPFSAEEWVKEAKNLRRVLAEAIQPDDHPEDTRARGAPEAVAELVEKRRARKR